MAGKAENAGKAGNAGDPGGGLVPPGFLFGVATSGFQIEGGYNGPGEPANNWVGWERSGRVEPSGTACDFWRHPEPALDRASAIGCDAFRLSVEWARLEPEEGEPDDTALDRYVEILGMCAERGLEPVVTLHHFTHPWWLGDEFWLTPGSPDRFAAHVARILPRLAPHCRRWVTVNEPNIVALMGWVDGSCPPGRRGAVADAWAVADNLLTAHVLAYSAVHAAQPGAQVTTNTSTSTLYDYDRIVTDLLCARSMGVDREALDGWIGGRRSAHDAASPPPGLGDLVLRRLFAAASPYGPAWAGRLRRPCPRRVVDAVYDAPDDRLLDAVGLDWYDPVAAHALRLPGHHTAGGRAWEPSRALWDVVADPDRLTAWCRDQHAFTPDLPVWVVENGMATRVRNGRGHHRLDGWDRPRYLRAHVGAVVAAVRDGAPVTAYLHWSLVDNYEWGTYEPRFGIFGVDRARYGDGVRWLDTDADGADAAGAFRRLVDGVRAGDASVLAAG
ncbi:MAG: family 1 glycosylhydrolase [Acidimicrobiales bacterium]